METTKNKKQNLKFVIKQAVKEAVREVFREEMASLLEEVRETKPSPVESKRLSPSDFSIPQEANDPGKNYISEIFNQVKSSLSSEDVKKFSGNSPIVHFDNPVQPSPKVGVSIDNLDFVKRASTVYNLANEKSRNKN